MTVRLLKLPEKDATTLQLNINGVNYPVLYLRSRNPKPAIEEKSPAERLFDEGNKSLEGLIADRFVFNKITLKVVFNFCFPPVSQVSKLAREGHTFALNGFAFKISHLIVEKDGLEDLWIEGYLK